MPLDSIAERRYYYSSLTARSSSGLGRRPLKAEITGSNPVRATKNSRRLELCLWPVFFYAESVGIFRGGYLHYNSLSDMPCKPWNTKMHMIQGTYELADKDEDKFVKRLLRGAVGRNDYEQSGLAYSLSKNFVVWYAQKCAFEYGPAGIRVCSVSPGLVETGMGVAEKEASGELGFTDKMIERAAERRLGKPEELGFAIATIADQRNGYLAGVDVLIDGGSTNGGEFRDGRTAK